MASSLSRRDLHEKGILVWDAALRDSPFLQQGVFLPQHARHGNALLEALALYVSASTPSTPSDRPDVSFPCLWSASEVEGSLNSTVSTVVETDSTSSGHPLDALTRSESPDQVPH